MNLEMAYSIGQLYNEFSQEPIRIWNESYRDHNYKGVGGEICLAHVIPSPPLHTSMDGMLAHCKVSFQE